jgi:hypothetical protein
MAETVANIILVSVPIIGELDDSARVLGPITYEGVGESARLVVLLLQDLHSQSVAVKFEAFI